MKSSYVGGDFFSTSNFSLRAHAPESESIHAPESELEKYMISDLFFIMSN